MLTLKHLKYLLIFIWSIQQVRSDEWYTASDGSNYLVHAEYRYNWYDAVYECAARGLSLATITSEKKNKALVEVLKKTGKDHYWIGAVSGNNRSFFWIVTGEQFEYSYWWTGEPNGNGDENCVHIDGYDYHWNDNNCARNRFALLCEESPQNIQLKKFIEDLENYIDGISTK